MAENVEMIRPINLPEAQQLSENDVFILDSETGGVRKIPKNKVYTPVDDTLSVSGEAADAKVTGEKIDELKGETALIQNPVGNKSGELVSFSDGADMPAQSVIVNIEPVQSGTGTPSPDNVRPISGWESVVLTDAGKNMLKVDSANAIGKGVTQTLNEDGTITLSGTSTGINNGQAINGSVLFKLPTGTYRFVDVGETSGATFYYYLRVSGNSAWIRSGETFTVSEGSSGCWIVLYFPTGTEVSGTHGLMIVNENDTYDTYEPYTGTTTTVNLGRTVYGGTLDVVSGELTVTHIIRNMTSDLSWNMYTNGGYNVHRIRMDDIKASGHTTDYLVSHFAKMSNIYAQIKDGDVRNFAFNAYNLEFVLHQTTTAEEWKAFLDEQVANGTPVQVYRYLATPQTYTLTPTEVKTLLGDNNVWADSGDVEITYRRDINIVIDELTNAIVSLGGNV